MSIITNRMSKTMKDKMFFYYYNKKWFKQFNVIIDFGCADSTLLLTLHKLLPRYRQVRLIGIENNGALYNKSYDLMRKNTTQYHRLELYTMLERIKNIVSEDKVLVIFSSVLHEVGNKWLDIKKWCYNYADYIAVRDMIAPNTTSFEPLTIKEKYRPLLDSYIKEWSDINTSWHLYHFLLKYRYIKNWDLEVKENYFLTPWNELMQMGSIIYERCYFIKWIYKRTWKDWRYKMKENTHCQWIIKMKKRL